jgi:hypothetical protein
MPRPKSELTGNSKHVSVRLTPKMREEWERVGGQAWLRRMLANSLQDRYEQERKETQTDTTAESSESGRTAQMVAVPKSVWQVVRKAT